MTLYVDGQRDAHGHYHWVFGLRYVKISEAIMSIFKEMYPHEQFDSWRDFTELQRMLAESIARGRVEEVPVIKKHPMVRVVNWYRDKGSGEIYSLKPPDFPARGIWEKVDVEDLKRSDLV